MCRSSRIPAFAFGLLAATPALGQPRLILGHAPVFGSPRPALHLVQPKSRIGAPQIVPRTFASVPRLAGRPRFGTFGRANGFGFYGPGLGLALASDLAMPPPGDEESPPPDAQHAPPVALPPCSRPLLIKIGTGLRHPAHARIVYGTPIGCRL